MNRKKLDFCLIIIIGMVAMFLGGCNLPGRLPSEIPVAPTRPKGTEGIPSPQVQIITPTAAIFNTLAPLPSSQPVASPTPAGRPGASLEAVYFASPPVLDGDWSDFTGSEYPCEVVVYGLSNWKDRNDLAGSLRVGWDLNNLYLGVKIRDENFVQNATGEELFKGDSLEILLDADLLGDFEDDDPGADDYQMGFGLGKPDVNQKTEAYLWFPLSKKGPVVGVKIVANRDVVQGITRAEVAIPWSHFGIIPRVGNRFGFAFSISDNDNSYENIQQSMVSTATMRNLVDPTSWGELLLGK